MTLQSKNPTPDQPDPTDAQAAALLAGSQQKAVQTLVDLLDCDSSVARVQAAKALLQEFRRVSRTSVDDVLGPEATEAVRNKVRAKLKILAPDEKSA